VVEDCTSYDITVKFADTKLMKMMLRTALFFPGSLTQAIRNFAKGLESWLTAAMAGCPEEMMHIKVSAVSALAQTLRRYTSLNHLAQAARAVLQNSSQIDQMLVDLNRVDFHNVQEQVCIGTTKVQLSIRTVLSDERKITFLVYYCI